MKNTKTTLRASIGFIVLGLISVYLISAHTSILHGQVPPSPKIIAFGDSLVLGTGSTAGNNFVSVLSRRIGTTIINRGVSGRTTATALNDLDSQVIAEDPDIVILVIGANDILQGVPQETRINNLRTLIQRTQASGAKVILVATHGPSFSNAVENAYAALASETGAGYVPNVMSGIVGNPALTGNDLLHPNDQGYQLMADRIFPVLQSTINSLPNQTLTVTCSSSRTTAGTNQTVTWTAFATGGTGSYTYAWSGSDGLSGTTSTVTHTYATGGTQTASVTVTSGTATVTQNCTNTVAVTEIPLTGLCSLQVVSTSGGYSISYSAYVLGGSGTTTTYSWTGEDGLTGNSLSLTKTYTTPGLKSATLNARSGSQTLTLTCSASIDPSTIATSTVSTPTNYVSANCMPTINNGRTVTWNSSNAARNGAASTFTWSGTEGLSLVGTTSPSSIIKTYDSDGVKTANVAIQSDGVTHTLSCQVAVASTTSSGGGCFIATAAYGTELDPHVVALRKFRDEKLMTNELGAKFVQGYYKYSPVIADYIAESEDLKAVVRTGLWPIVTLVENFQ